LAEIQFFKKCLFLFAIFGCHGQFYRIDIVGPMKYHRNFGRARITTSKISGTSKNSYITYCIFVTHKKMLPVPHVPPFTVAPSLPHPPQIFTHHHQHFPTPTLLNTNTNNAIITPPPAIEKRKTYSYLTTTVTTSYITSLF